MDQEITHYIETRYRRWMEHSVYCCNRQGIPSEAGDVLNEVLLSLLQKPPEFLRKLYSTTNEKGRTGLDYYVFKMIRLNASSPTSPYQSQYKTIPADRNADYTRMEIEDPCEEPEDRQAVLLEKFHQVREAYHQLELSELAKKVFEFKFFQDNSFSAWSGKENKKQLYGIYNGVERLVREKINKRSIF